MEADLLKGYIAVAEHESFTAASDNLPISQSGLSQQVRRLERLLGVELFRRTTTRVELTDTGQLLLPLARRIVDTESELLATARRHSGAFDVTENLKLLVVENGTGPLLMDLIERARTAVPELRVEVAQTTTYDTKDLLAANERSAVIHRRLPGSNEWPTRSTTLRDETLVLVAPSNLGLAPAISVADLDDIELRHMSWLPSTWFDWFPPLAGSQPSEDSTMVVTSTRDAVRSVSIDQQACIVPRPIAEASVEGDCTISVIVDAPKLELVLTTPPAAGSPFDRVIGCLHDAALALGTPRPALVG